MRGTVIEKTRSNGATDVAHGLSKKPKALPGWLFYDEKGHQIFQEITRMPEYYLSRCETEIMQVYKRDLLDYFLVQNKSFQLIEFGAGDGFKTEILLKYFVSRGVKFIYRPVDISETVLADLTARLQKNLPTIVIQPIQNNYHQVIEELNGDDKKVVFFMGATIGNFTQTEALTFLQNIALNITTKDLALIGFDLKKDPRIIERAYDDAKGLSRDFNFNILLRLNKEFGATFKFDQFDHYPHYDPETGTAKSFLVSLKDQEVYLSALSRTFRFSQWETINTVVSQKYDLMMIEKLISEAGLELVDLFFDAEHFFCDVLLKKDNR